MGARADNLDCEDGKSLSAPRTVVLNRLHLTLITTNEQSHGDIYSMCQLTPHSLLTSNQFKGDQITLLFDLVAWNC